MKPFLTKEQSDWLIKQLNQKAEYDLPDEDADSFDAFSDGLMAAEERVKRIINQCTEKKFPELKMLAFAPATTNMFVDVPKDSKIEIIPHVVTKEPTLLLTNEGDIFGCRFTTNEFKRFTDGCNKIMEYLDEQNNI